MAKTILALSALAGLVVSASLLACLTRRDYPGTVTFVSPLSSGSPSLQVVFDPGVDTEHVPVLFSNRGYWILGCPPDALYAAATVGDRLMVRWRRMEPPVVGWHTDLVEYHLQKGPQTLTFSEGLPWHFWGPLAAIAAAPFLVGCFVAGIAAAAIEKKVRRAC